MVGQNFNPGKEEQATRENFDWAGGKCIEKFKKFQLNIQTN